MKLYDVEDFQLQLRDELDLFGLVQHGKYEPVETEVVKQFVKEGDVALDIGANIGYYTILMSKLGADVWAYEPELNNFKMLLENFKLNRSDKIHVTNIAISDTKGKLNLHLAKVGENQINYGMHRLYPSKWCEGFETVPTDTIDNQAAKHGWEKVDFVKIDVEGWEYNVIKGMWKTIIAWHPTIMMEFHPPTLREAGYQPYQLYSTLKEAGYDIYLIPDVTPINFEALYHETDKISGRNILARYAMK